MKQLSSLLEEYLDIRRALGAKLKDPEWLLRQFVAFVARREATHITVDLALRWACEPQNVSDHYRYRRLAEVRKFAQFVHVADARHQLVPQGLLTCRRHRPQPYIYTTDQIVELMNAAAQLSGHLRPLTHFTMLGLLAATGMRSGEVVRLDRCDVDLPRGLIAIRNAKFGKSRMVPCHQTTQQALREYAARRDQLLDEGCCEAFFLSDRGTRITQGTLQRTFVGLSRTVGLRNADSSSGPRLQDLRHTFAVATMIRWYREDVDVESRLPHLATWLGHTSIAESYWYLSAVPELMQLSAQKFDRASNRRQS